MTEPKQFGDKYLLLDTLGTGGMAEIFKGKLIGEKGFEKLIVIKKLRDHLKKDQVMVRHFINEARLAALLQHDNIACIYDFGSIEGSDYIAMEYLFGKDLSSFLEKIKEKTGGMRPEIALYVTSCICDAMAYAHNLKDLQNNDLHIIHRDLTPHNIFITYEGKIKVIDFGIAKNEMQDNKTQVGVVKGKISYMSPEQLSGAPLDHRSDIFSIGILLYEMLSGQRLYTGEIAEIIPKAIKARYKPLQDLVPDLPPQLYAVVEKALQKDFTKRYQSCSDMQTDVEECLFSYSQRITPKVMKKFALELFEKEHEEETENATRIMSNTDYYSTKTNTYDSLHEKEKLNHEKTEVVATPLEKKFPRKVLYLSAATTVVVIVIFLAWQFIGGNSPEAVVANGSKEVSSQVPAQTLVAQNEKSDQKSETQKRVEELLLLAAEAERKNNVIGRENSAFELYSEILYLVDTNEQALKGKERIVEKIYNNILADIKDGEIQRAQQGINKFTPTALTNHQADELQAIIKQNQTSRTQELWRKGEEAFYAGRLSTPSDDCALKYYKKIEANDPNSTLYREGYYKIANKYLSLAESAHRKGKVPTARQYVENGLAVVPNHERLLALRKELNIPAPVAGAAGFIKNIKDYMK